MEAPEFQTPTACFAPPRASKAKDQRVLSTEETMSFLKAAEDKKSLDRFEGLLQGPKQLPILLLGGSLLQL